MQLELKRLQHELGITFIVVTHDQEEALVMANRIALMKDGRVVQVADPRTLYEEPASRFVAQFIGVTNLLEGHATNSGLAVPDIGEIRANTAPYAEKACALSIRPERITLTADRQSGDINSIEGTIADIAYHGQDLNVRVALSSHEAPLTVRVPAAHESDATLEIGRKVWCNWRPENGRILTN